MAREPIGRSDETRLNAQLAGKDVQPFALGSEALRPGARLAGLDRVGERLARRLRDVFEPFARVKPKVEAEAALTSRFRDMARCAARVHLAEPLSAAPHERRHADRGRTPDYVSRLVDAFYGGTGGSTGGAPRKREFTAAEERLLSQAHRCDRRRGGRSVGRYRPARAYRSLRARPMPAMPASCAVTNRWWCSASRYRRAADRARRASIWFSRWARCAPTKRSLLPRSMPRPGPVDSEFRYRMARALQNVSACRCDRWSPGRRCRSANCSRSRRAT